MKTKLLSLLLALALPALLSAQTETSSAPEAPKSPAELAAEALWTQWRAEAPAGVEHPSREFFLFQDRKNQQWAKDVRAFLARYPDYPQRNELIVQGGYSTPFFIAGFKPEFDEAPNQSNLIVDTAARAAFVAEQARLITTAVEDPAASYRVRGGGYFWLLAEERMLARKENRPVNLAPFRELADRVVAKFNDERVMPVVEQYIQALRQQSPEAADAYEAELQAQPALAAAMQAATEKRQAEAAKAAEAARLRATDLGSLKFTAADGREVDLAALRGKVVLVDFWATWCGPCIAELPTIKKVYAEYHAQGFEIIGITLENTGIRPNDTDAQKATKLETARQKLLEFTAKNEMPWPQHFDGKHFKNDYAVKFGINSIPAMFLLAKDGTVASAEARGEKLESEVKRLLAL